MPVGNVKFASHANMPLGKMTGQTLGAAALRLGAKAGLGSNVKAAQRKTDMGDQAYALAMNDIKSGGAKSGKTAAVATKQPSRASGKTVSKTASAGLSGGRAGGSGGGSAGRTSQATKATGAASGGKGIPTPKRKPGTAVVLAKR